MSPPDDEPPLPPEDPLRTEETLLATVFVADDVVREARPSAAERTALSVCVTLCAAVAARLELRVPPAPAGAPALVSEAACALEPPADEPPAPLGESLHAVVRGPR